MAEIKVSVVIPVYNSEKYLPRCLDSVLAQTLREIEVICVDDGSTDGSPEILEKYAAKDRRVTVLHQKNEYAGAARNHGMEHAHGEYLVFWDSDDMFDADALNKMYAGAVKDQAQICACGARMLDNETQKTFTVSRYMIRGRLPEKRPFNREDIGRYLFNFCSVVPWNKLFLRSFVEQEQLRFQTLQRANDVRFVVLALFRAERITVVEDALITYRYFNENSLTGKSSSTAWCTAEAYGTTWDELAADPRFTAPLRQSFANKCIGPLMDAFRMLQDGEEAEKLYNYYKTELFPRFGLYNQKPEFFNSDVDYRRFQVIPETDCRGFMLYEMRSFRQQLTRAQGQLATAQGELALIGRVLPFIKAGRWLKRKLERKRK